MKKYLFYVSYLLAVVFVGLVICEMLLDWHEARGWKQLDASTRPYYQWCYNNYRGERIGLRRGRLKLMYHPYLVYSNLPNQTDPHFHINCIGARGPEIGSKIPGKKRIVILGGSAAFGTGLDIDSETLARQLQIALPNTEVINAAVIGYQSRQELTAYVNKWCDLSPDVVIEFGGINDYLWATDRTPDFGGMSSAFEMQTELVKLHRLAYADLPTRLANGYRVFFPHIIKRIDAVVARLGKTITPRSEPNGIPNQISPSAFYASNMDKLNKIARANKARFLCVLQPVRFPVRNTMYVSFRKDAKSRLVTAGVDVVDAQDIMPRLYPSMFMDEVHLDPEGNRIAAEALAQALRKRGL